MGGTQSIFTEQQLADYQELTYFTKKEILHVHKRFKLLDMETVDQNANAKLPKDKIMDLQELKVNPFKDRICEVFSSSGDGDMTFEDFLDMMSVFSDNAPKNVKVEYAFRIYDMDGDDKITASDLREVINRLTGGLNYDEIDADEMKQRRKSTVLEEKERANLTKTLEETYMDDMIKKIFEEADLDDDNSLSFAEFEHVISKAPDFVNSFRIRL